LAHPSPPHPKAAGILVYDTAVVPRHLDLGFTFIGIGADGAFVADGATRFLSSVRDPAARTGG
jgi:2-keto-3-deoxy-L-rhamnonate aldolase RhmA